VEKEKKEMGKTQNCYWRHRAQNKITCLLKRKKKMDIIEVRCGNVPEVITNNNLCLQESQQPINIKKKKVSLGAMAHVYNLIYLGGRDWEDLSSRQT
jgi:hypothetical protein